MTNNTEFKGKNMTRHYSITIDGPSVAFVAHRDMESASETEMARRSEGYESHAFGSVNDDSYLIVYTRSGQ